MKTHGWELCPIPMGESLFSKAPVTKQYPQEMYYRLLAGHLLPREVKRVLYLDPDILVINPLKPLCRWTCRETSLPQLPIQGKQSWQTA